MLFARSAFFEPNRFDDQPAGLMLGGVVDRVTRFFLSCGVAAGGSVAQRQRSEATRAADRSL
jgi:hypothetical protein